MHFTNFVVIIHLIFFYLLDPVFPKKYEMKISASQRAPPVIPLALLPKELKPDFDSDEWNNGRYEILSSAPIYDIYVYTFPGTQAANGLKKDTPDLFTPNILYAAGNIDELLPPCDVSFSTYTKPNGYFEDYRIPQFREYLQQSK